MLILTFWLIRIAHHYKYILHLRILKNENEIRINQVSAKQTRNKFIKGSERIPVSNNGLKIC